MANDYYICDCVECKKREREVFQQNAKEFQQNSEEFQQNYDSTQSDFDSFSNVGWTELDGLKEEVRALKEQINQLSDAMRTVENTFPGIFKKGPSDYDY